MKIGTFNIQGLNNPDKLKALWKWLLTLDLDILCVQEHKLHDNAGKVQHCNGYTLFYGGSPPSYSGTMTFVKNHLKPTLVLNHTSGRLLGIQIASEFGNLHICNVYGPNAAAARGELWDYLAQIPSLEGVVCGDFNMVEDKAHSATGAAVMQSGEKAKWDSLQSNHRFSDTWEGKLPDKGFTYHSQAYSKAWARLDRLYIVNVAWCPPVMDTFVDYKSHLSDHFPVVASFNEYDWLNQMKGCNIKRPLIVNNLVLKKLCFNILYYLHCLLYLLCI